MRANIFHVFQNTPLGRETLMQAIYFCQTLDVELTVYVPEAARFLMYFDYDAVQINLDRSYISGTKTATERVRALVADAGLKPRFLRPENRTASDLPDIPTNFAVMSCPRNIGDTTAKTGLGYIGPKVRRIIRAANFPVFMTTPVFKPWKSVAVLFGGSESALNALRSGVQVARRSGFPLDLFIQLEQEPDYYDQRIQEAGLQEAVDRFCRQRYCFVNGGFANNLYSLPHDALVFSGAHGGGSISHILFGGKAEAAQSILPNNMLLSGPQSVINLN